METMKRYSNYLMSILLLITLSKTSFSYSMQSVFTHIYDTHAWPGKESCSGPGSTLKETEIIRKKIPVLLQEFNIKTLLDAPCGDCNWIQHVDLSYLDHYIGLDIVPDLIQQNRQKYENKTHRFVCANIVTDSLPQVDIILCRDCLVHLKFQDIVKTLKNMKASKSVYLLTTTFPQIKSNRDLAKTGQWRPLNLQRPPFNFPEPLLLIKEGCKHDKRYFDKSLGLWKIEDIEI